MKTTASSILIILSLVCVGLLPKAHAVVPPPDGGYPGFNTAEGTNALQNLTTGVGNAAVGWYSLFSNTDGSFNTAVGAGTLLFNVGNQSQSNGVQNTAIGTAALLFSTTGSINTALGTQALFSNTEGDGNTATGWKALASNTTGNANTAIGDEALFSNTTGNGNTATGTAALLFNTDGSSNTANGDTALQNNITGDDNTAIGEGALFTSTGNGNTALGTGAGNSVTTANNVIAIGTGGANVNDSCFIGNIRGVTTGIADAVNVVIDSNGQLGTMSSSRRFKNEIKPLGSASEAIHALKPVTFQYNSDKTDTPQFGLIAEEVADVNPDLVVRDNEGEIYTVRYDAVNAMLLNEFLKEHRKNEEQGVTIALQQKQIDALTAGLQKVSAQLEASKPPLQVVNNR